MTIERSVDDYKDACDRLYEAIVVANLLKQLSDCPLEDDALHLADLGHLIHRLVNKPLDILNDLRQAAEKEIS